MPNKFFIVVMQVALMVTFVSAEEPAVKLDPQRAFDLLRIKIVDHGGRIDRPSCAECSRKAREGDMLRFNDA